MLRAELERPDVVAWLRCSPRTPWALCIPWEHRGRGGQHRALYPDFLFVRQQGAAFVCDVLEPHDISRDDSWAKARGLAEFARRHGEHFGRLAMLVVDGDRIRALDVNEVAIRERVLALTSNDGLQALFREL